MIWYFIGIYIINRTLHGRFEMWNFSYVEKYCTSERSERVKYFSTLQEKFHISVWSCNILYLLFLFLGVEKNNDDARKVLRRKSNNWDSPTNILQTETCLWALCKRERKPRAYNKKNEKYWNFDIKASRAKRRRISTQMKEWKNVSTTIALVVSIFSHRETIPCCNMCFKSNHTF